MGFGDDWQKEREREDRERKQWAGDYDGTRCPNCHRERVLKCVNGKRICEKCCHDPDTGAVSESPYHIKQFMG